MAGFGSITRFHQFVLEGNEAALEQFYQRGRQAPVLGDQEFRERLREKAVRVDREHPRHERAAVRPSVDEVLARISHQEKMQRLNNI